MRKSFSFLLGVLVAFVGNTFAQIPISSLPPATVPLTGTEQVILNQGTPGTTKRASVSSIGSATIGKPAGSFQAFFQSGDIQWNNNGAMFGTDQFIAGTLIPLPDGTNGDALLLGSGYGPGGSPNPGKAWIITDQAFDNFTPGNTLGITAGETQGAGTANGGLLWLLGGASFGGTGGQLLLQGGTSANGPGGTVIVQGGNATGPTGAAIAGDVFIEGGTAGRAGANVQLISTTLNGISGTIRLRNNSTFLWDFNTDGSVFSYLGGGYGTSGNALTTQGAGLPAKWSPVVTGPAGANTQIQFNNSGVLGASADFTFNSGTRTLNVGSTGAFVMEPVVNAAGAGRALTIRSGGSSLAGNSGGTLDMRAGIANGAASGALAQLTGGAAGTTGTGGAVQIFGGAGGSTSGQGGGVTITGNTPTNGVGGQASLIGGDGAGTNRAGGAAGVQGGNSVGNATGGAATVIAGQAFGTGLGGPVTITGGASNSTNTGGSVTISGGANLSTGTPGAVTLKGGDANGGAATSGGVNIQAGTPLAGGPNGSIQISANQGGIGGGNVSVTAAGTVTISPNTTTTFTGGTSSTFDVLVSAPQTVGASFGLQITAGTNASDLIMQVKDATAATTHLNWFGDGGLVFDGATGGDKGLGTINVAGGFYQNGVQVIPTVSCQTSCSVAGMPVGQTVQVMKTGATNRSSTIAPTADPDLQFTNVPIGRYIMQFEVQSSYAAANGVRISLSSVTSTSAIGLLQNDCNGASATPNLLSVTLTAATMQSCSGLGAGGFAHLSMTEGVLVSALSTVSINWAQGASGVTATSVDPGSFLKLTRLQ